MTLAVIVTDPETLRQIVREELAALRLQAPAPAPIKLAYSITEAAEATSTSPWCIRTAIKRGELHAKQAGERGAYAIPAESLREWLRGVPNLTVPAQPGARQRKAR